jgi:Sulfotransferase family
MTAARRPVLVTGSHRSGSTWIGMTLALDPHSGYIPEPFNRRNRPGICRAGFPYQFFHLTPANAGPYRAALADTLAWRYSPRAERARVKRAGDLARMARDAAYFQTMRMRGARPIMKDPIALFSADWLADSFDMGVVVVVRHPAAFVASLRAAGWGNFPFADLRDQPALMADRLAPFAAAIEAAAATPPEPVEAGILLWNLFHHQIARYRAERPGWLFPRHEDVSADPQAGFRDLYAALGLDFTPAVARGLAEISTAAAPRPLDAARRLARRATHIRTKPWLNRDSRGNIRAWQTRLTPDEIARIRDGTAAVAEGFYGPGDW